MQRRRKAEDTDRLIVRYDPERKRVTISFQGSIHVLPQTFGSYDDAMIAGYAYARANGWEGV